MPSGLTSTSSNGIGCSSVSAASLGNGSADRPWKEVVQSTLSFCRSPSSSARGASSRPDARLVTLGGGAVVEVEDGARAAEVEVVVLVALLLLVVEEVGFGGGV